MTTHIRIPDIAPVVQDTADGSRKTFDFPFPIFTAADLEVLVGDVAASDYEVIGEGSSKGGAVKFTVAPAAGLRVTLRRRQTYARTEDFLDERAPTPHELNDAVDQNVAAIQELAEEASRAVHRSMSADLSRPVDLTLPEPESGRVIGWSGSADALVNLTQVDVSDMLHKSQNLADLPDKAQARINLGLGSVATHDISEFASAAQGAKADTAVQPGNLGTAAYLNVGTAAGQVVQLDASGKLPAVEGSQLTSLNAEALTSGTVSTARLGSGAANASSFLRGDGTWTAMSSISVKGALQMQVVTTSGTFVVPNGVTSLKATVIGGGGGGGGSTWKGANGGGGGAGAIGIKVLSTLVPGSSIAVTIGDGGDGAYNAARGATGGATSIIANGTTLTAGGGQGGNYDALNSNWVGYPGTLTGPFDLMVSSHMDPQYYVGASCIYGIGANNNANATGYGSGGGGGYNPDGAGRGGKGSAGAVIFEWIA